jgi:putative acetyltransferase
LSSCRELGFDAVVVLGDPAFYKRLGFVRASDKGIGNAYRADDHFMVLELRQGALSGISGVAKYAPEFEKAGC